MTLTSEYSDSVHESTVLGMLVRVVVRDFAGLDELVEIKYCVSEVQLQ